MPDPTAAGVVPVDPAPPAAFLGVPVVPPGPGRRRPRVRPGARPPVLFVSPADLGVEASRQAVGLAVYALRVRRGVTQRQLAAALGVPAKVVAGLELGRPTAAGLEDLLALLAALGGGWKDLARAAEGEGA